MAMIPQQQDERIRRRLARGEKCKDIAAAENVGLGAVYRIAEIVWRNSRDSLSNFALQEATRRCPGCGLLLYETMAECLQCKIEMLSEQDRRAKAAVRSTSGG